MASEGLFRAGGFLFPTVTGDYSVTGLGFQPQGVIFFGGNQPDIDTLVHPTAPGVFFGMAWLNVDNGLVDYQSQANTTYGVRWASRPITCISTGATIEYQADTITFDADGFTIHVNDAAPGDRLVHWLAWGDFTGAEGASRGSTGPTNFDIPALGYRPLSMLDFAMFSSGASRDGNAANWVYYSMGSACFPEADTDNHNDNAQAITFRSVGTTSQGWTQQYHRQLDDGITASVRGFLAGTYQTNIDHLSPYPTYTDEALRLRIFGFPNRQSLVWWDCEAFIDAVTVPAAAAVAAHTAPSYIAEIQAAIFYGTTGYGSEEQLGVNVAYGFGVLTPDYQGCVAFDTGRGDPPADGTKSFYQSQDACLISCLSPRDGVRVASGQIVNNQVLLTGEIDTNPSFGANFMHAWGRVQALWMGQSYRFLQDWTLPAGKPPEQSS